MSELPSLFSYENDPIVTFEVGVTTTFALYEYMDLRGVSLGQAIRDLLTLGLAAYESTTMGNELIEQYPNGILPYEANEKIYDEVKDIPQIQALLQDDLKIILQYIAEDLGVDQNTAFARLIENARTLFIKDKKGAELFRITPDGKAKQLKFVYKNQE
jgi:hypothetical protein